MKLAIFLIFSCLCTSVFTLSTTSEKLRKIAQGEFGRTLLDTIQLEFKSSTDADPRPRILQLLQEIKDEANEAISDLNTQHSSDQQNCETNQQELQDAIDNLNSQIQGASAEIAAKTNELSSVNAARDAKQTIVDTLQPYLDRITAQREQDQEKFEAADNKQAQIIAVLERTRQFITERLEVRQSEGGSASFLEKENVLIQVKEKVMSAEFQKLSPGWSRLISFIATKALNKLKQDDSDAVATAGLQRIIDLINTLLADHNLLRSSAQVDNDAAKASFEDESADAENQLSSARADILSNEAQISTLQSRISELTTTINSKTEVLENKKDALYQSNRDCTAANQQYSEALAARTAELGLIDEVIAIVNNDLSNLRQFTEDTIINSDIVVN